MRKSVKSPFWLGARHAAPHARANPPKTDKKRPLIVQLDRALLGSIPLFRYSVSSNKKRIPESFALCRTFDNSFGACGNKAQAIEMRFTRPTEARIEIAFDLSARFACFGLGERYSGLNLRGRIHTLFTTDDHRHLESSDALYKSIPLLYLFHSKGSFLIFLDSPAPQRWDLDSKLNEQSRIEVHTRRGFHLYVAGPAPLPSLLKLYTEMTGRVPLPPRWSLGHQQSRWSYPTEATVRQIAKEFRKRQIPCDTLVVDIDYMEDYRVFSISKDRFPTFEKMTRDLRKDGFHVVPIVDPGVARSKRDPVYTEGLKQDIFCKTKEGKPFVGKVWAGNSCLPDFLLERTRQFWGKHIRSLLDHGVSGIWNDMNEPALFGQQRPFDPSQQILPKKNEQLFLQSTPEGLEGHFEVRGLYGMQMARAAWEAQAAHRPLERPFTLTRSTYAGGQRYGAVWLGDNCSWFEHLRHSVPMLLNMGLSGFAFAGVDIGGFMGHADAELLLRFYQLGIFFPFYRNHCAMGQHPQEPWAFGPSVEASIKRLITARYSLTHYIEALFVEHQETGAPLMRPMAYHYPFDKHANCLDDQFFFGRDILVAPLLKRGTRERVVYFPKGVFESFDKGQLFEGPGYQRITWGYDEVPAFIRHGAILPFCSPFEHMGEINNTKLTLRCYGSNATGRLWLDDGISPDPIGTGSGDYVLKLSRGTFSAVARHQRPYQSNRSIVVQALGKCFPFELPE
jgi:alpha-glucosidase